MFELIKQVPVISQAYGLTKTAMKVYNSTDPISAVKNATLSIIEDCAPPQVKYPIKCGILLAQLGLAISSGGNPWAVALAIGSARQIIE
jgi:hypothetical protein